MRKLIKLLFLFTGLVSTFAICPDFPTLPSSPIPSTNPVVITPTSPGVSNFPASTAQLSIATTITPQDGCAGGETEFSLFTLTVTPPQQAETVVLRSFIVCNGYIVRSEGDSFSLPQASLGTGDPSQTISIFYTIDLAAGRVKVEFQTQDRTSLNRGSIPAQTFTFDASTKIYLCSGKGGAAPISCAVSSLQLDYRAFGDEDYALGHVGGTTPSLASAYPFTDGPAPSLADNTGSGRSGYFGNDPSSPTAGTSPSWDSSNTFVQITSPGQFLSFPLPPLEPGTQTTSQTLAVAAWIRVTSIPQLTTTIFTINDGPNGNEVLRLTVDQSSRQLALYRDTTQIPNIGERPQLALNTWQLVGFSISLRSDSRRIAGTLFAGTSSCQITNNFNAAFPTLALLQIGSAASSFIGDIANLRIMTPGGGYITTGNDVCSPNNDIELGSGPFSLDCAGSQFLNFADSQCYATCPSGTQPYTGPAIPLCVSRTCPSNCKTCDSTGCLTCEDTYLLYKGACVSSCPAKTYSTGSTCESCSAKCDTCDREGCLICEAGYLLYSDYCVDSCPAKTYSTGLTCENCPIKCKTCNSKGCILCDLAYSSKKRQLKSVAEL